MAQNGNPEETVTFTLDGQEITVPKGTTLLQAAEAIGTRVPHYCYHPGLSAPAQCRLCLVEVEGAPKLQASCITQAQDDQVVHTQSEQALAMRTGVLEFYLANHPLDCPICDQSGECEFQDYVHAEGPKRGRNREPKRVFGRDDFGGDILFYGDRCVMCTRCVRFMNEVAQDPRLTVVERGSRSVIDTFFEEGLDGSPFHGNIADICPVGALVSKDFLHKARAWDLDRTPSICPNCSQGCNIELHVRDNQVQRLQPRDNPDVNQHWMCDYGRHRYEWMNRPGRLLVPLGGEAAAEPAGTGPTEGDGTVAGEAPRSMVDPLRGAQPGARGEWQPVLESLSSQLEELNGVEVMAVASPFASNEDLGALRRLVDHLGGGRILFRSRRAEEEIPLPGFPTLTRRKDLAPNRRGAELMGMERVGNDDGLGGLEEAASHEGLLLVLGDDLADQPQDFGAGSRLFVHLGSHPAAVPAGYTLPITTFAEGEGTFTNHEGRVQRFWPGLQAPGSACPAWLVLGALLAQLQGTSAPTGADEAFLLAAKSVTAFQGMSYPDLGVRGALVNDPVPLPGG